MIATIIISILLVLISLCLYGIYRLNLYISKLEKIILEQVRLSNNLKDSLKELVVDGFLLEDGRLKKYLYTNNDLVVFNGVDVKDQITEI